MTLQDPIVYWTRNQMIGFWQLNRSKARNPFFASAIIFLAIFTIILTMKRDEIYPVSGETWVVFFIFRWKNPTVIRVSCSNLMYGILDVMRETKDIPKNLSINSHYRIQACICSRDIKMAVYRRVNIQYHQRVVLCDVRRDDKKHIRFKII